MEFFSIAASLCGWLCVASLFCLLISCHLKSWGAVVGFALAGLGAMGGWWYCRGEAQKLNTHPPASIAVAAAEAPAPPPAVPMPTPAPDAGAPDAATQAAAPVPAPALEWCQETPTEHCMLKACFASIKDGKPTFVLMGADWCPSCNLIKFFIKYLDVPKATLAKYRLVYIDSDANPDLAAAVPNRSIPAGFVLGDSCEITQMYEGTDALKLFLKESRFDALQ